MKELNTGKLMGKKAFKKSQFKIPNFFKVFNVFLSIK